MLDKMLSLAAMAHEGQFDKAGKPYFLHPLAVMQMLPSWVDDEVRMIALGHDLLEDTSLSYLSLKELGFSNRVADGIWHLTKTPSTCYESYQNNILSDIDTAIVKYCDLRHNSDITRLKGITEKDTERLVRYTKFATKIKNMLDTHGGIWL